MTNKEIERRKRDLSLKAFFRKVQGLIKELEQKYPELKLINLEETQSGKSRKVKNERKAA